MLRHSSYSKYVHYDSLNVFVVKSFRSITQTFSGYQESAESFICLSEKVRSCFGLHIFIIVLGKESLTFPESFRVEG